MPISNNIVTIDGTAIRPAPKFSIGHETFKSGDYIIGGITKITFNGEIIGLSEEDLQTKISNIMAYSGTCRSLIISCAGSDAINGSAFFKSVSINPSDQPFFVNYTIEAEISNIDGGNTLSVQRDTEFDTLYGLTIPANMSLKSYEENLSLSGDDGLSNSGVFVGQTYTKAQIKLSGKISIQAHHHMCESFTDIIDDLYNAIRPRFQKMITLDASLANTYPSLAAYCGSSVYSAINDNKSVSINKLENKIDISFDLYLVPNININEPAKAIVDISVVENTDQSTRLSSLTVRGSIKGLSNVTSDVLDHKVLQREKLSNAIDVYNTIAKENISEDYPNYEIFGCTNAGSLPSNMCYQRISSQVTQNINTGQIDFELTYGDTESCQMGGTTIDISISEDYPTQKHVEHIIPGLGTALIQVGENFSPMKIQISASGKLNSCNGDIETLKSCVNTQILNEITNRGYNNYILVNRNSTTGRFSYKISYSYIGLYEL